MTPGNPPSGTPMTPAELNRRLDQIETAIRRLRSNLAESHDRMGLRQLNTVILDQWYAIQTDLSKETPQ